VNICIVEDNRMLLDNLRLLLQGEADMEVVGGFCSAEEALAQMDWSRVDMLLADIDLPGISGVELIGKVKEAHPGVEALAYTICEDRAVVMAAIRAGASGYLLKGSTPRVLIESIREQHAGGAPMTPKIARKLILEFRLKEAPRGELDAANSGSVLTPREIAILRLVVKGLSYGEIADQLKISPHTVHAHIKNIYEKLQARSRQDMLLKARRLGAI
jgi:two-component system NarL family response regulator